jgi:hypothetical protein
MSSERGLNALTLPAIHVLLLVLSSDLVILVRAQITKDLVLYSRNRHNAYGRETRDFMH